MAAAAGSWGRVVARVATAVLRTSVQEPRGRTHLLACWVMIRLAPRWKVQQIRQSARVSVPPMASRLAVKLYPRTSSATMPPASARTVQATTRRRRLIQASQPEAPCSAAINPGSEMDATTEAEEFGFGPGFSPVAGEGPRLHQSRIAEPRRASGTRAAQTANSNPRMNSRQNAAALMGRPPGANSPLERRYAGTRKITAAAAS